MGSLVTLLMVCTLVFFVIFAAKSKNHFNDSDAFIERHKGEMQEKRTDES